MVVQVLEQLPILDQPLLEPGAIVGAQRLKRLQRRISLDLAHNKRVPKRAERASPIRPSPSRFCRSVETMGLEPTTPCLQSRCSSQLSYVPVALYCPRG